MAEVAKAYVSLLPSAKGFGKGVSNQIGGDLDSAGRSGGKRLGAGLSGGFLPSIKGLMGPVAALFAVGAITSFFKSANAEARESQKVNALTANVIKTTGGVAKITAGQVGELSMAISNKTGIDDEAIQHGANLLLTFKNIRNEVGKGSDIFDRATAAAADLAASGFGDIAGASKMLGKALNDPLKGITALGRAGVTFSEGQKKQIKTMVEHGNLLGAQKLMMIEVESQVGGAAAASSTAGEKLATTWKNLKETLGTALLPVIDTAMTAVSGFLGEMTSGFQTGEGAGGKFRDILVGIWKNGIKPIATFITDTALPAIKDFIKGFQDGTGAGGKFKDLLILIYNDAIKPIGDFLVNTAIPAIKDFVKGFQDGTGPGGKFRDILKKVYDDGIVPLATFITGTALPALKSIETWITTKGGPALLKLIQWFKDSKDSLETVATLITVVMLPIFLDLAAKAVASAVTQAAAWVSTQVAGQTSAASQLASHYVIVGGWVVSTAKAVTSAATTVAIWALYKAEAIKGAATSVGAHLAIAGGWIASAAAAVASAATQVARWVAIAAASVAAAIKTAAAFVVIAAGWVSTAATATASAATMAAAWVVGLGPVAWVIAGIAALIAIIVVIAKKTTWFQTIWEYTWGAIKVAFTATVNHFKAQFTDFVRVFGGLPGRINGAIGDLGSLLYDKGRAVIQGLINGVRSMVGNLASAVGNAIKQGITDLLPGSPVKKGPLRVLNRGRAGGQIVTMLAGGIDSQRAAMEASMTGLVSLPRVGSLDFASSAQRSAAVGGGFDYDRLASLLAAAAMTTSVRSTSAAQVSRTLAMAGGTR